jgi:type I restriction-modification system DNA methylase subunit
MDNSKIINQINQLFHNKGVKQEERFNLLIELLENNKKGVPNEQFKEIIQLIETFDYSNADLIQQIFMSIGSKYIKYNLDQFYTPLTISLFINRLMITGPEYNAIDPAGGTGDLLLYYNGNKTVWDIDENALKLCKFNYELNKQCDYNLVCKNSLENFEGSESTYSYSTMNPPFGSNTVITDSKILDKFELGRGKKKQEIGVLFLELGLKLLKNDGILFIIVPAGYVGNGNKVCSEMRDLILKNRLIASISLPENTFKRSGTGVNTYLLIIQKKTIPPTEPYNIFISGVNNIGYNLTKKDTPVKYKYVKETGATIVDGDNNPVVDNDLLDIYDQLCSFKMDNSLLGLKAANFETEYEYIESNKLSSNIIDIKRYLQSYLGVVDKLTALNATQVKNLGKIIKTTTKIEDTRQYKYIDISEINSPLYGYKELYGWELPSRAKYSLKQNDILVSKLEGTMSYCVILEDDVNYIATNGVSVIRPNNLQALYVLMTNIMSKDFVIQHTAFLTGSIMASLSDTDIEEFLVDDKNVDIESSKRILETLKTLQQLRR